MGMHLLYRVQNRGKIKKESVFLFLLTFLFWSPYTFASSGVYEALAVEENEITASFNNYDHSAELITLVSLHKKTVGGLSCRKYKEKGAATTAYLCLLHPALLDAEAIYNTFDVDEISIEVPDTYLKYQKTLGNLSCTRTLNQADVNMFECQLSEIVDARCVPFNEICQREDCTGGITLVDSHGNNLFFYRHFYHDNARNDCEALRKTGEPRDE